MRSFYLLFALSIALAGTSAALFLKSRAAAEGTAAEGAATISRSLEKFAKSEASTREVNLAQLLASRAAPELRDPATSLPSTQNFPYSEITRLHSFAKTCDTGLQASQRHPVLRKSWAWHNYLCGITPRLADDFFETSPRIHPNGSTFVALAMASGRPEFRSEAWKKRHTSGLVHLMETPELQGVSPSQAQTLTANIPWLKIQNEIWLRRAESSDANGVRYGVFPAEKWDSHFSREPLAPLGPEIFGQPCPIPFEGTCWASNPQVGSRLAWYGAIFAFMAFVVLSTLLMITVIRRNAARKAEMERRSFLLKMLAHEVRTPATGLKLSLEALRGDFDRMPETSQRAFLQMCDQVQRLTGVTEASQQYLAAASSNGKLAVVHPQDVTSINDFMSGVITRSAENRASDVQLRLLPLDRSAWLDPYWVEICISNLIRNALQHGKAPIQVEVQFKGDRISFQVKDQGTLGKAHLVDLTEGRILSAHRGMGLGLSIVQAIADAMGAQMYFSPDPTTFKIELRQEKLK